LAIKLIMTRSLPPGKTSATDQLLNLGNDS
jgi:hypothetical protein